MDGGGWHERTILVEGADEGSLGNSIAQVVLHLGQAVEGGGDAELQLHAALALKQPPPRLQNPIRQRLVLVSNLSKKVL